MLKCCNRFVANVAHPLQHFFLSIFFEEVPPDYFERGKVPVRGFSYKTARSEMTGKLGT